LGLKSSGALERQDEQEKKERGEAISASAANVRAVGNCCPYTRLKATIIMCTPHTIYHLNPKRCSASLTHLGHRPLSFNRYRIPTQQPTPLQVAFDVFSFAASSRIGLGLLGRFFSVSLLSSAGASLEAAWPWSLTSEAGVSDCCLPCARSGSGDWRPALGADMVAGFGGSARGVRRDCCFGGEVGVVRLVWVRCWWRVSVDVYSRNVDKAYLVDRERIQWLDMVSEKTCFILLKIWRGSKKTGALTSRVARPPHYLLTSPD